MTAATTPTGTPGRVCICCNAAEDGDVTGGEVDEVTGLCVTCQPCAICGAGGGECWDDGALGYCDNAGRIGASGSVP